MTNQTIMWWAAGLIILAVGAWLLLGMKDDSAMMEKDSMQKTEQTGAMMDDKKAGDGAMMDDKKMDDGAMMEASGTVKVQ